MQEAWLTGWLAGYQQVRQDKELWVGAIIKPHYYHK